VGSCFNCALKAVAGVLVIAGFAFVALWSANSQRHAREWEADRWGRGIDEMTALEREVGREAALERGLELLDEFDRHGELRQVNLEIGRLLNRMGRQEEAFAYFEEADREGLLRNEERQ